MSDPLTGRAALAVDRQAETCRRELTGSGPAAREPRTPRPSCNRQFRLGCGEGSEPPFGVLPVVASVKRPLRLDMAATGRAVGRRWCQRGSEGNAETTTDADPIGLCVLAGERHRTCDGFRVAERRPSGVRWSGTCDPRSADRVGGCGSTANTGGGVRLSGRVGCAGAPGRRVLPGREGRKLGPSLDLGRLARRGGCSRALPRLSSRLDRKPGSGVVLCCFGSPLELAGCADGAHDRDAGRFEPAGVFTRERGPAGGVPVARAPALAADQQHVARHPVTDLRGFVASAQGPRRTGPTYEPESSGGFGPTHASKLIGNPS